MGPRSVLQWPMPRADRRELLDAAIKAGASRDYRKATELLSLLIAPQRLPGRGPTLPRPGPLRVRRPWTRHRGLPLLPPRGRRCRPPASLARPLLPRLRPPRGGGPAAAAGAPRPILTRRDLGISRRRPAQAPQDQGGRKLPREGHRLGPPGQEHLPRLPQRPLRPRGTPPLAGRRRHGQAAARLRRRQRPRGGRLSGCGGPRPSRETGRIPEAIADCEAALAAAPGDPSIRWVRADLLLAAGRTPEAFREFEAIRATHPDLPGPARRRRRLGQARARRSHSARAATRPAVSDCMPLLRASPKDAALRSIAAESLRALGELERSRDHWMRAIEAAPEEAEFPPRPGPRPLRPRRLIRPPSPPPSAPASSGPRARR